MIEMFTINSTINSTMGGTMGGTIYTREIKQSPLEDDTEKKLTA